MRSQLDHRPIKTERIMFPLDPDEKRTILREAYRQGISASQFVRAAALEAVAAAAPPPARPSTGERR